MNDLLPVGSIVELSNKKRYMIIGYNPDKPNEKNSHDYVACLPKLGLIREMANSHLNIDYFYINKKDIEKVLFIGYNDIQFDNFDYCLFVINTNLNIAKSKNKNLSKEEITEIYLNSLQKIKGGEIK